MYSYGFEGGYYLWEEQEVDSLWTRETDTLNQVMTFEGNVMGERRCLGEELRRSEAINAKPRPDWSPGRIQRKLAAQPFIPS